MAVNWRDLGDTTVEEYVSEFKRFNSPLLGEAKSVWEAARPHSKLALAMMYVEQKHATLSSIPADYHNPLSLARPGGTPADGVNRWMRYSTYEQGVRAWKDRVTSETYKDGIYAKTVTLADLIRVYAPPSENATNLYIDTVQAIVNRLPTLTEETPDVPDLNMTKGLIPLPGFVDQAGTFAKRENVGMNRLGPRHIDVLFVHRALGGTAVGVADWLKRPDVQGLTDWVIDHTTAYMIRLVDIYGKGGDMTGWAQGPYRKPVPGLVALTAEHGGDVNSVNRYGESIEVSGFYEDPISPACKRDLARWIASRAHDRGIRWDRYPLTPAGYVFVYSHHQSCGKDIKICAGPVVDQFVFGPQMDFDSECTAMVRGILKAAQTGGKTPSTTTTARPAPKPRYAKPKPIPGLMDLELDDVAGLAAVTTKEGTTFRPVTWQVVAVRDTPRFQVAGVATKARVGPDIKKGEDFNPAWVFTDKTGEEWYVTPFWSRVRVQDTERVHDEPLKG